MPTQGQDVAQEWKGFDENRRKELLARMSPAQKKNLRSALETPTGQAKPTVTPTTDAPPQPSAVSRFLSSAWAPIKSAATGLYEAAVEGPQNPEEAHIVGEGQGDFKKILFIQWTHEACRY